MRHLLTALLMLACGLAATAHARPRTVPDRLVEFSEGAGVWQLEKTGKSVPAGVIILQPSIARKRLDAMKAVEVKSIGIDRYGRAQVMLYAPGAPQPIQEAWLREGSAVIYDPVATPAAWRKAEQVAREKKRGIWGERGSIRSAASIENQPGQFQLVAGTVTRTYKARDAYYINFGADWKTDFSVKVPRRAWRSFKEALEVMPGSIMLVRGTMISENGPMIVATRPEQLEQLHAYPR